MLKAYFQFERYDSEYQFLNRTRKRRSRSFVQGFLKLMYPLLDTDQTITITDINGASQTSIGSSNNNFSQHILASTAAGRKGVNVAEQRNTSTGLTSVSVGIVAGTGTTAVTPTDFQLATRIADGVSSGTLEYFPSSGTGLTISNPTGSFRLERLFRNSSGGTITINEIGIYSMGDYDNPPATFCTVRDLVFPGFAIADGEYARVIYTLSITV